VVGEVGQRRDALVPRALRQGARADTRSKRKPHVAALTRCAATRRQEIPMNGYLSGNKAPTDEDFKCEAAAQRSASHQRAWLWL